jgi:hypothetical protein
MLTSAPQPNTGAYRLHRSQRDLVAASLLACPRDVKSARARRF